MLLIGELLGELKETFFAYLVGRFLLKSLICVPLIILVVIVISMLLIEIINWLVMTQRIIINGLHDFFLFRFNSNANKGVIWVKNLFNRL